VSFDVAPGVITGLLGPNGAGKTTLLRILLGVLTPDRGEVRYDDQPVGEDDRRHWGYMPQDRGLYPGMPAGDQVAYFGRLHGLSRRDATSRAHALLAELGLEDRWRDRTDKLSGGMQQRLQLAASLAHDPLVIVLDEPFAGLDPVAVASLSETLRLRARDGRTVLFSSHQLDLVQDLCEDIAMVDRGRTVLLGSVARLRASSGRRQLRLHVEAPSHDWLLAYPDIPWSVMRPTTCVWRFRRASTLWRCWMPHGRPGGWSTSGSNCPPCRSCSWLPPTGPSIRQGCADERLVEGHGPGR